MQENLKTKLLEFEKSSFLLDVVKHQHGKLYVSITHTVTAKGETPDRQIIKINQSILPKIIEVLKDYQTFINEKENHSKNKTSNDISNQIVNRYLKNISIKDLMIQFDCKEELIKQILRNNDIVIVEELKPMKRKRR